MTYDNLENESKTIHEGTGFTQISNNVINNIKDGDAFLVWCYLFSKTRNWKTIKENIKNVYGFGDTKLKKIFSYLKRANLIDYVQTKSAYGHFNTVQIRILNGAKFDKTQSWLEDAPVVQKPAPAVNRTSGNGALRNKEVTKEEREHNKEDLNNSAAKLAHENLGYGFDSFWDRHPVKKNKMRAKRIWEKKRLYLKVDDICNDLVNRIKNDSQWQDKQYIPHPATYLVNELWNDEISERKSKSSGGDALSRVINKHLNNKGHTYDQHGNTYDPLR